jgi:hypothetical protein
MEVVIVVLDMADFSFTIQRGRISFYRALQPSKFLLIVVMDENIGGHQNIGVIVG